MLKLAALAGLVGYIFRDLDTVKIIETYSKLPLKVFIYAPIVQVLILILMALRWKVLMGDKTIPFHDFLAFTSLGSIISLVSPSVLIADGANAYFLGKRNNILARSVAAVMAGRLLGLLALCVFFLCTLPWHINLIADLEFALKGIPKSTLLLSPLFIIIGAIVWFKFRIKIIKALKEGVSICKNYRVILSALLLSFIIQAAHAFWGYLGYRYSGIPVSYANILFLSPLTTFLCYIPVTFGQVGWREVVSIFFFTLLPGVSKEQILAMAGYGYTIFVIMACINALIVFFTFRQKRA